MFESSFPPRLRTRMSIGARSMPCPFQSIRIWILRTRRTSHTRPTISFESQTVRGLGLPRSIAMVEASFKRRRHDR